MEAFCNSSMQDAADLECVSAVSETTDKTEKAREDKQNKLKCKMGREKFAKRKS